MRTLITALLGTAALATAACGSDDASSSIAPAAAKAQVERAAKVKLVAEPVPAEARDQGLEASFSNAKTVVKDGQVVGVFVLESEDVADEVTEMVRASSPKTARLIVNGTVLVVYAPVGADRGAAVERAVKAL